MISKDNKKQDLQVANASHCIYFSSLEDKLLKQSQRLTKIMKKSVIKEMSLNKNKESRNISSNTFQQKKQKISQQHQQTSLNEQFQYIENRESFSMGCPRISIPYSIKYKDICDKLKSSIELVQKIKKRKKNQADKQNHKNQAQHSSNQLHINQQPEYQTEKSIQKQLTTRHQSIRPVCFSQNETTQSISSQSFQTNRLFHRVELSHFNIIKTLAESKERSVFLVQHKFSNFICALKRITIESFDFSQKMINQRIRQIKIQTFLDHPNIIQLYSVFVQNNNIYILLQLCCQGNLYNHLKSQGRFTQQKIKLIIRQVCHAIEYMHDNDIIHRDLKPQNILFHQNVIKICDFGWSINSPLLRNTVCGSPVYTAPESVQKQNYDSKVDIWNIGVLTYELLYGKVPFQIRSEQDLSKVIDEQLYFPRSKPASVQIKNFILSCLSKNPKERCSITKLIDHQFLTLAAK